MNAPVAPEILGAAQAEASNLLIAPSLTQRRLQCYLALLVSDLIAIVAGFCSIGYLVMGVRGADESLLLAEMLFPIYLTVALYNGAFSIDALRRCSTGVARAMFAMAIGLVAVIFVHFLVKASTEFSRIGFIAGAAGAMAIMTWGRVQMRAFVRWRCGSNVINELVIDDGGPQVKIRGAIRISAAGMGIRLNLNDPHMLDRVGLVLRNIDRVIVSCPPERRESWAIVLKGANVDGEVIDDEVARLGAQGARVSGGYGLLMVSAGPLGLRDRAIKRLFDVTFSGGAIIALSPLLVAVALAVKLQDGGPVLFVQRRIGRGNRFFSMYKFRSMTQSLCDADGNQSASREDQRITRIGRFIRATSIDELPQLFNVLLGDMSLVGPRPHAMGSLAGSKLFWEVDLRYWQRHCLKPGLSGLAQIRGFRGATDRESDLVKRLQADLEYLEGWTILRDIQILFMTLRVLVHDRAY